MGNSTLYFRFFIYGAFTFGFLGCLIELAEGAIVFAFIGGASFIVSVAAVQALKFIYKEIMTL
jgi:hypothetical protein